jgi:hypothetical protein
MEQARREHNESAGRLLAPAEKIVGANAEPARDESPSGYYSNLTAIATGLKKIT